MVELMGIGKRGTRKYASKTVRREDGRSTSVYLGSGPVAELVEAANAARCKQREASDEERRRMEMSEEKLKELHAVCTAIVTAAFLASGFHRHDRGRWRKRRRN